MQRVSVGWSVENVTVDSESQQLLDQSAPFTSGTLGFLVGRRKAKMKVADLSAVILDRGHIVLVGAHQTCLAVET